MNLYRHFNSEGQLLYVGISNSALVRLGAHKANAHWFDSITKVTIEKCTDREDALTKEAKAIQIEHPLFNKMHNTAKCSYPSKEQIHHELFEVFASMSKIASWFFWVLVQQRNPVTNECIYKAEGINESKNISRAFKELHKLNLVNRTQQQHYMIQPHAVGLINALFGTHYQDSSDCLRQFK
jgi:hypothetical protein